MFTAFGASLDRRALLGRRAVVGNFGALDVERHAGAALGDRAVVDGEQPVPTVAEVVELHDAAPDDFAVAIVAAAGLGLRASEVAGVTVDRIDFLRREVTVDRQWHGQLDRFEAPKSKASNRTIPAGATVLDALALHIEQHGTGEHGVLLHAAGRPLNANRMTWRWERTVRDIVTDLTMHDLRHHFASSLISAGCSIVAVQRALGHAKPSTTLDTYSHLMPSDQDRMRGAIDEAWKAVADQPRTETPGATR
jgi:integrase